MCGATDGPQRTDFSAANVPGGPTFLPRTFQGVTGFGGDQFLGDKPPWLALGLDQCLYINKVVQYCYYIPNAPQLISERVRIQTFLGASPQNPALTNPPRFARLIPYILTTTNYLVLDL